MMKAGTIALMALGWFLIGFSVRGETQPSNVEQRINALEASLKNARVSIDEQNEQIALLRGELKLKPTWGQNELKSAVNEIVEGEFWVLENGRLRRVQSK